MKKTVKIISGALGIVMSSSFALGLCGCNARDDYNDSDYISELAESLGVALMGNDIFSWNAFSVSPKRSFGYVRTSEPSWYSYSATTKSEAQEMNELFSEVYEELLTINASKLDPAAKIDYNALKRVSSSYADYYGSKNVVDIELISGAYISSEGGYVADFATNFENFVFRNESDVKDLLTVTVSTEKAFKSYLDYAADRALKGYPLYDYTITAMQDYLGDVIEAGDEYYLYSFVNDKLDEVDFLSAERKQYYKTEYKNALDENFMGGVITLNAGLDDYKGRVTQTEQSYLGAYGELGREYYKWKFNNLTGLNLDYNDIGDIYEDIYDNEYSLYYADCTDILTEIADLETSDAATYNDFYAYLNGEKAVLGMSEPQQMLDWLKETAKSIVPDLGTAPQIGFKHMDETVASRTSTLAYYVRSPLDEPNSAEYITLNPTVDNVNELLLHIAHEGYPGHLYAAVKSKEQGAGLLPSITSCTAFSEGWAKYTELAVLDSIASSTDDKALSKYCEFISCDTKAGYLSMLISDIEVNFLGMTVDDYVENGYPEDRARLAIESMMEIPTLYVPYGYGMYYMYSLHDSAQEQLGDGYDEAEFNGKLLSEGFGPTLARAKELTDEYISSKK